MSNSKRYNHEYYLNKGKENMNRIVYCCGKPYKYWNLSRHRQTTSHLISQMSDDDRHQYLEGKREERKLKEIERLMAKLEKLQCQECIDF